MSDVVVRDHHGSLNRSYFDPPVKRGQWLGRFRHDLLGFPAFVLATIPPMGIDLPSGQVDDSALTGPAFHAGPAPAVRLAYNWAPAVSAAL
jgi:hypothetical protein